MEVGVMTDGTTLYAVLLLLVALFSYRRRLR